MTFYQRNSVEIKSSEVTNTMCAVRRKNAFDNMSMNDNISKAAIKRSVWRPLGVNRKQDNEKNVLFMITCTFLVHTNTYNFILKNATTSSQNTFHQFKFKTQMYMLTWLTAPSFPAGKLYKVAYRVQCRIRCILRAYSGYDGEEYG